MAPVPWVPLETCHWCQCMMELPLLKRGTSDITSIHVEPNYLDCHLWAITLSLSFFAIFSLSPIFTLYRRKRPYGFIHWKMTMWVLYNRPNGCKMEANGSQERINMRFCTSRHSFCTHFVIFFMDEPIGSFSPVQGDLPRYSCPGRS